jgi:hypothetical protein
MSYDDVIEAIQEHNLDWSDIDRIHVDVETYDEFHERASFNPSNYATIRKPAVRVTRKEQKIIYVDSRGLEREIGL